ASSRAVASASLAALRPGIMGAPADGPQLALQREAIQPLEWQIDEQAHARGDLEVDLVELRALRVGRPLEGCRILESPVRGHGLSWPHRTNLAGDVVADRDDHVHLWRVGILEHAPALARKAIDGMPQLFQLLD